MINSLIDAECNVYFTLFEELILYQSINDRISICGNIQPIYKTVTQDEEELHSVSTILGN